MRILVVEDNRMNAELARVLLEIDGHEVEHTATAAALRSRLAAGTRPDVILMDVGLTDADGRHLVGELRGLPRLADVPIIAVTAHALLGDAEKLLAAGFDGVITKPLDTRTFAGQVRCYVDAHRPAEGGV